MKTAKQWVDESNWSDELKELFWERNPIYKELPVPSLESLFTPFNFSWMWDADNEKEYIFWKEVAEGKRTDIDRLEHGTPVSWENTYGREADKEYETLMRRLLEGLKSEEESSGNDDFTRGFNAGIREMNEKIDEAIEKLEI